MQWRCTLCCCGRYNMKPATRPYTMRLQILSDLHLVDSTVKSRVKDMCPTHQGKARF